MRNQTRSQTKHLALLGLFSALILLLGLTPVGMIPLGFINLTTLHIPVVVGTLVLGLSDGLVLGAFFGAVSLYKALTSTTALVAPLLGQSILLVIAMCFVPRLLVPLVTDLVCRLLKGKKACVTVSAVCGSLTNTVMYLGMMLVFYVMCGIDAAAVLALIGGTGLLGGTGEAVLCGILTTPIVAALKRN